MLVVAFIVWRMKCRDHINTQAVDGVVPVNRRWRVNVIFWPKQNVLLVLIQTGFFCWQLFLKAHLKHIFWIYTQTLTLCSGFNRKFYIELKVTKLFQKLPWVATTVISRSPPKNEDVHEEPTSVDNGAMGPQCWDGVPCKCSCDWSIRWTQRLKLN